MTKLTLENHPLERAVLGALIADPQLFWQVKDRIRRELFTVHTHDYIAAIMQQLTNDGRDVSIPAIISRFPQKENSTFSIEGYLATLVADEADPDMFADHLQDLEEMWARREMAKLGGELIRQSTEDNGLNAMGRLEQAKLRVEAMGDPMSTSVRHIGVVAQELVQRVAAAATKEAPVGLDVGLKGLQDLAGALMPERLYVIAGPPGSGKSALMQQVCEFVAREQTVLVEEIEMSEDELVERNLAGALADTTDITADKIERAALNLEEIDQLIAAAEPLSDLRLYISSSSAPTLGQIRARAMRTQRLKGLGLLAVDHLLYIQRDGKLGEFEGIRANMRGMKKLARDLHVPVILLAQLKKEFGDVPWQQIRRPHVGDLYGGSSVEQEADVVIFVHREDYLLGRKEPSREDKDRALWEQRKSAAASKAELILGKRRGGQGFGIRTIFFSGPRVRFMDQWERPKATQTAQESMAL